MSKKDNSINKSLDKALKLLKYYDAEHETRGLTEISELSGISKATLYRLFNTFEKNGFLKKIDVLGKNNQYKLGFEFLKFGQLVFDNLEVRKIAYPFIKKLRDSLNEDVQLILKDGNYAIYVEKIKCDHPVRLYTKVGRKATLNAGACPRAILSFLEDEKINEIINQNNFIKYTENTIIDKSELWRSIKEARDKGYTISYGEMELNTVAVGVPIYDYMDNVIASISVAGPEQRFTKEKIKLIINKLKLCGNEISMALGSKIK